MGDASGRIGWVSPAGIRVRGKVTREAHEHGELLKKDVWR